MPAGGFINGVEYYSRFVESDGKGNYSFNVANGNWTVGLDSNGGDADTLDSILGPGNYVPPNWQNVTISNNIATINFTVQLTGGVPFNYTTNNGAITITGYIGSGGAVSIPSTINGLPVTSIGSWAFASTTLTSVIIPNSVTVISDGAFSYCPSLATITVDALNPVYNSVDGVLFDKSTNTLIQCPGGKVGGYIVPNSVCHHQEIMRSITAAA